MTPEHLYHDMVYFFAGHIRSGFKLIKPKCREDEYCFSKNFPGGLAIEVYPGLKNDQRGAKIIVRRVIRLILRSPDGKTLVRARDIDHRMGIWLTALDRQIGYLRAMALDARPFFDPKFQS